MRKLNGVIIDSVAPNDPEVLWVNPAASTDKSLGIFICEEGTWKDLTEALGNLAKSAYQKPVAGIPASDLASDAEAKIEIFQSNTVKGSDVTSALENGKLVGIKNNTTGEIYLYSGKEGSYYYFTTNLMPSGSGSHPNDYTFKQATLGTNSTGLSVGVDKYVESPQEKVTSISYSSTNAEYPSAKAVYEFVMSFHSAGSGNDNGSEE